MHAGTDTLGARMEQTFTSEFGGRFTVGQGPGRDGTRGNYDARGENHLCQLWISCLRAETWDASERFGAAADAAGCARGSWAARTS